MLDALIHWLFAATIVGYAVVSALYAVGAAAGNQRWMNAGFLALVGGFAAHSLVLGLGVFRQRFGDPAEAWLAIFSWSLLGCFLVAGGRYRIRNLGGFISSVALFVYLATLLRLGNEDFAPAGLRSFYFPVHFLFTLAGLALFGVAFSAAVGYLILERRLRRRLVSFARPGTLPSLEVLDRANHQVFTAGLLLYTVGIISGAFWAISPQSPAAVGSTKILVALVVWLIYALGWQARLQLGWRGRRAALVSVVGFLGAVLQMVAIRHV